MTFFFPSQAGTEPVGRGAGQQPRRVQIRARGLHLLTHRYGPAARAEHATPAGLLVCPGTSLETPNLQQKASGPTFWLALQTSDGQEGGLPWRFGTAGCRAAASFCWRMLMENAGWMGSGWSRCGTSSPKSSSSSGETQDCLPEAGVLGPPLFSWGKPSSFEMKPANKCIAESMFIHSDFSLL